MNEFVLSLDTRIFLWLNSFHSSYWDSVMQMISGKWSWTPVYCSLLYSIWRSYGWKTMLIMLIMCVAAVTAADMITASVIRPAFERLRPANPENPISDLVHIVNDYRGGRYGFPSCHAANTFAVASLMSLLFWRRSFTISILIWALLNCYSRIYLGVHYPGDLLVGAVIGMTCGTISFIIAGLAVKYWKGSVPLRKRDAFIVTIYDGTRFRFRPVDLTAALIGVTVLFILILSAAIR